MKRWWLKLLDLHSSSSALLSCSFTLFFGSGLAANLLSTYSSWNVVHTTSSFFFCFGLAYSASFYFVHMLVGWTCSGLARDMALDGCR